MADEDPFDQTIAADLHARFGIMHYQHTRLVEAQQSTPVFAKAEYALKRLLWLGG